MDAKCLQIVVVEDAPALAEAAARRLIERVTRKGPRRGRADRRLESAGTLPPARRRAVAQRSAVGSRALVHRRRPFRSGNRSARAIWARRDACFSTASRAPRQNIHPIATDANYPEGAARLYEDELKAFYGAERLDPARPMFDLVLMGLGGDGHTASLFPNSPALNETQRWVLGIAKAGMEPFVPRVTLTFPALASTREMLFLIDSADKRAILSRVLSGEDLPARRAYADGELVWLVVRAAAPER